MGESKSDYEILTLLAERLGMKELFTEGNTEDDWARLFYESSDLAKTLSWEDFEKKGYHIIPCPAEGVQAAPGLALVRRGPRRRYRRYGQSEARHRRRPRNWEPIPARSSSPRKACGRICPTTRSGRCVPHWIPSWEGYKTGPYEKYPLQIISAAPAFQLPHPLRQSHSWLNEIPLHRVLKDGYYWWPARIHPDDAAARNVKTGDIVELYNDRASVLCIAEVTWRVAKGVIHSYGCTGRYDPLEPGKPGSTEKGGCVNMLTSSRMVSKHAPG